MKIEEIQEKLLTADDIVAYAFIEEAENITLTQEEKENSLYCDLLAGNTIATDIEVNDVSYYEWRELCKELGVNVAAVNTIHRLEKKDIETYHFVLDCEVKEEVFADDMERFFLNLEEDEKAAYVSDLLVEDRLVLPIHSLIYKTDTWEETVARGNSYAMCADMFSSQAGRYDELVKEGGKITIYNEVLEEEIDNFYFPAKK